MIDYKRQIGIFNPEDYDKPVTIVGLGNTGSWTALALARLGIKNFNLYDDDRVESHNLSSQAFDHAGVGYHKVVMVKEAIEAINPDASIRWSIAKFTGNEPVEGILIIAVDTLEGRRSILANVKEQDTQPIAIIDGRMGGSQLEVYTCQNIYEWEGSIPAGAEPDACGGQYICYISMTIASFIANQVKRILKGEELKKTIILHLDTYQII